MNWRVVTVQIITALIVFVLLIWAYVVITDDRLNVSVKNKTGYEISMFALVYGEQHCSVTKLPNNESIYCTLESSGSNQIGIKGRVNNDAYIINNIGGLKSGKSFRNSIALEPGKAYDLKSKQVIN